MATLVVKLLDFIRLDIQWAFTGLHNDPYLHGDTHLFSDQYHRFFARSITLYQLSKPVRPVFWQQEVLNRALPIRRLFSRNPPQAINQVVSTLVELGGPGYQYEGVNFYNYFAVDGPQAALLDLLKKWRTYLAPEGTAFDPLEQPLEVMYLKGIPAQPKPFTEYEDPWPNHPFPGPPWPEAQREDVNPAFNQPQQPFKLLKAVKPVDPLTQTFWQDVNIAPLLITHAALFGPASVNQRTRTIHDVEGNWDLTDPRLATLSQISLKYGTNPDLNSTAFARWHGACVLSLLVAQHHVADPVKGIAPQANVLLYSCYVDDTEDHTDDALLNVLYQHLYSPGDVLLLERELKQAPSYDGTASPVGERNYPVEVEQAIFDLISLATHSLGLLVVEPAGNQHSDSREPGAASVDLDAYEPHPFTKRALARIAASSFSGATKQDVKTWNFYRRCVHRPRYLTYDPVNDSGAVMVGAAARTSAGGWQRISNSGSRLDVYAPGDRIPIGSNGSGNGVNIFWGTSGASALMAGSVGLLQQIRQATGERTWLANDLRTALRHGLVVPHTLPDVNLADITSIAG